MTNIKISISNQFVIATKAKKISNIIPFNSRNLKTVLTFELSEIYIENNKNKVVKHLMDNINKYNIDWLIINDLEIAETVLEIIKEIPNIKNISFMEDKELNYNITSLLLENKNLENIYCYNIPLVMYNQFYEQNIETRCNFPSKSRFMTYNELNSYAKVLQKDIIKVKGILSESESKELEFILKTNLRIKTINIYNYERNTLKLVCNILSKLHIKNINILIIENSYVTEKILSDIEYISELSENFDFDIKIKYSKEYKEKNKIKQLNIDMFKYCALGVTIISGIFIGLYYYKDFKSKDNLESNIDKITEVTEVIENIENVKVDYIDYEEAEVEESSNPNYVSPYRTAYSNVYEELLTINKDTVGWLKVNNTKINYPVVQATDNDYYLKRAFDKSKNKAGWLFADYRNNFDELSDNTIIYGHTMKSGHIFGTLQYVLEPSWYNNLDNLTITFNVKDQPLKWQIFSIYTIENTNDYLVSDFSSKEAFMNYMNMFKQRSIKDFGVHINEDDRIITLSTCYGSGAKYRLVVHAKLI